MRFDASVHVAAGPERVWEVYSDVERWPEWTASISSVERLDDGPLRVGSRTRIRQPRLPAAVWEVTELVDGESFTWVAKGPGATTIGGHQVVPTAEGAEASNSIEQRGPLGVLIGLLYRGLIRRYLELELASLKTRSES